jgi:hypothetical protein
MKLKSFCSKGNGQETEETAYRLGENTCQLYYDKGLITRIASSKLISQRIIKPPNKWANELSRKFSKEEV